MDKVHIRLYDCHVGGNPDVPSYLSVRETAVRLGVHENTVRNWVREGILASARLPGTKFHRFDSRDVERLRQQRGATVASVERERRTIGPELVDASQLHQWAATRDAQAKFPELLRRLLASTSGVTSVSARAGEGVSLSGWDGRADSNGTAFLPRGHLFLEFGVGRNPKAKADEEYEKRRGRPLDATPGESVFVFVTPRRWLGAAGWAAGRRDEAFFGDVRVLDADDLEGWLQTTPAVHHWISEQLGRRPRDAETLEGWWGRFQSRTAPSLPGALFLAGRETERKQLTEFFGAAPNVVAVQATWRDEAIAFVCATIECLVPPYRAQPPLVVLSAEVWERVVVQPGRMTLLPLFDDPDIAAATGRGHHVVSALGRDQVAKGSKIALPPPHRQAASEALGMVGVGSERSYRLAALARRSMPSLVRSLARDPRRSRPRWAQPPFAAVIAPLCLLGAWAASDSDREIVSRMVEEPWPQVERALTQWLTTDDPPFVRSGPQWHLASPEEAFLVLRDAITTSDLGRWHEQAIAVLLEVDPTLDLAPEEQPMAGALGVARSHSSVLRRGIAEGVALIGSIEGDILADGTTGADHAGAVVREILTRANADESDGIWPSLADILPLLAEAAPEVFLDAIRYDLDRPSPLLRAMFQDGEQASWLYTSSPHTSLLWALETLCWSSEWILEASRTLARLAQVDPGGRLSNRPLESLQGALVGWIPHTSATLMQKVGVIETICRQMPDTGWPLLFKLWPQAHAMSSVPSGPRFRDWRPEHLTVSLAEWTEFVGHLVRLSIELAGTDPERWAQLAEHLGPLPPADKDCVLGFLEQVIRPDSLDPHEALLVWERVHAEISRHRSFPAAEWSMDNGPLLRLEAIAARLEPSTVARFGYLFDWHPDLPEIDVEDHAAYDEKLMQLRVEAVREALDEGSADSLGALAQRSAVPAHLGWVVGAVAPEDLTPAMLCWLDSDEEKLREVAATWASRRLQDQGLPWLHAVLSRPEMTIPSRRVTLVLSAPATREVWDALREIDEDLWDAYWRGMNPWRVEPDDEEYAAQQLITRDRAWAAVDLLAMASRRTADRNAPIPLRLVEAVLDEALRSDPSGTPSQTLGYAVGQLLDYLEAEGADAEKLAGYEFTFFRLLEHHRQPRALFGAMGSDPSLFVDLVNRVYRGKNESKRQLDASEEALARHAWWVLHNLVRPPRSTG